MQPHDGDFEKFQDTIKLIEEQIPSCLTQGVDGRYYATDAGAAKLQELFRSHGIPVTVRVNEFFRFEVIGDFDSDKEIRLFEI